MPRISKAIFYSLDSGDRTSIPQAIRIGAIRSPQGHLKRGWGGYSPEDPPVLRRSGFADLMVIAKKGSFRSRFRTGMTAVSVQNGLCGKRIRTYGIIHELDRTGRKIKQQKEKD